MQEEESITKKLLNFDRISIVTITWNLFGSLPPTNCLAQLAASEFLLPAPEVIFFATQECQHDLWVTCCCESKAAWEDMLCECFSDYFILAGETMRGLHSAVLVLKKFREECRIYRVDKLKAGAFGCMGTKGAISSIVVVMGSLLQFINCHLASGQGEVQDRNATLMRIAEQLVEKEKSCEVIFTGDFNYRINMSQQQYSKLIKEHSSNTEKNMKYQSFLDKDQLGQQHSLKKFFEAFEEGQITFPPTYKLQLNAEQYSNNRIPGWTDRIFHKTSRSLKRDNYGCEYEVRGCDHRPVLARFTKKQQGPRFTVNKSETENCQLI